MLTNTNIQKLDDSTYQKACDIYKQKGKISTVKYIRSSTGMGLKESLMCFNSYIKGYVSNSDYNTFHLITYITKEGKYKSTIINQNPVVFTIDNKCGILFCRDVSYSDYLLFNQNN